MLLEQGLSNASACPPNTPCWSCSRLARRCASKTAACPCNKCLWQAPRQPGIILIRLRPKGVVFSSLSLWQAGSASGCRDRELLAQAGLQAFKSNAACLWVGQGKANALQAMHAKAKFRQKFQAWREWAERRCLLRDRLRLVLIACRRTTLTAGTAMQDIQHAAGRMVAGRIC